jgi:Flp pilus assembly protein CpaB
MRPLTFILLILVLLALAALGGYFVLQGMSGNGPLADLLGADTPTPAASPVDVGGEEPGAAPPTATPSRFVQVVVARVPLPIGQVLTPDLLEIEVRPDTNIAVQAGVTFDTVDDLVGQVVGTTVAAGQEILAGMLALNPTDLSSVGSDLALYITQGRVAIAFPIDRYSGMAYAMRPGDLVDVLMTLRLVTIDEEFQSADTNLMARVDQQALVNGAAFLFPPTTEGRIEFVPDINAIAVIAPGNGQRQIPRRITQLTIQQAEVLWTGTWNVPGVGPEFPADAFVAQPTPVPDANATPLPQPTPTRLRPEARPDLVILSLTAQDALALKWALETGVDIDLVLRAQGDTSVFLTTSVSLPQLIEQGGLTVPAPLDVGLEPPVQLVPTPGVAPSPPGD